MEMRARLVARLLESLNVPVQEEIDRLWAVAPMTKNTRRCLTNR